MKTAVLKFGGSSVSDNIKLNAVSDKIIELKKDFEKIVVVVSAQGKMTDKLIKEAQELSAVPNEREMDMLISVGEQITASKLSILLNRKGHIAISLTGWQAGIFTNSIYRQAKIEKIFIKRLEEELELNKIVIVAGFQGINENNDITTLGRGGSDTTAVALQSALNADKCYIFSDVDGIYSTDPNIVKTAKKLDTISFEEMQEIADAGAKVLHNRCIKIGEKFNCDIVAKSTFSDGTGTKICKKIEDSEVKGIVKNDKLILIKMSKDSEINDEDFYNVYNKLLENNLMVEEFLKTKNSISFRVELSEQNKVQEILEINYPDFLITQNNVIKLSIVGYGIAQDGKVLNCIVKILNKAKVKISNINLTQSKIEIISDSIDDKVIEELHSNLINKEV